MIALPGGLAGNVLVEATIVTALGLSAFLFLRIGVVNLSLDPIVLAGAAVYAIASHREVHPLLSSLAAFAVVVGLCLSLVLAAVRAALNDLLLAVGMYFFTTGLTPVLCYFYDESPKYIELNAGSYGRESVLVVLLGVVVLVAVALDRLWYVRLAKVQGVPRNPVASGLGRRTLTGMAVVSGTLAACLATLTGIYWVEVAGVYSPGLTHETGFVGLALAAVSSRRLPLLLLWSVTLALLNAAGLSLAAIEGLIPGEFRGVEYVVPFAAVIVWLAASSWRAKRVDRSPTPRAKYPSFSVERLPSGESSTT